MSKNPTPGQVTRAQLEKAKFLIEHTEQNLASLLSLWIMQELQAYSRKNRDRTFLLQVHDGYICLTQVGASTHFCIPTDFLVELQQDYPSHVHPQLYVTVRNGEVLS